jgi:hypothetical protein
MRLLAVTALAGLGLAAVATPAAGAEPDQAPPCISARVHFGPAPHGDLRSLRLPWISAGARGREIVGYLWYYTPQLRAGDRLVIYVGGRVPGGPATKIMWVPRRVGGRVLSVAGRRLDGPGAFAQEFLVARSGRRILFPSIVDLPATGCWLLTVRNGSYRARFAVVALSA